MIINIDTDFLLEKEISPDEFVLLKALSLGDYELLCVLELVPDIDRLIELGYIDTVKLPYQMTDLQLTSKAKEMLNITISNLSVLCEKFKLIWKGTKPGSSSDLNTIIHRMKKFKELYPDYDAEMILLAANMYIISLKGEYRYIINAANFILREDVVGGFESNLSVWCERVMEGEELDYDSITNA